jgi:hypothetical protein
MKKTDTGYATGADVALLSALLSALPGAPSAAPPIDANIVAPGDWRGAA